MLHDNIALSQTLSDGGNVYMQQKRDTGTVWRPPLVWKERASSKNISSPPASSDDLSDYDLIELVERDLEMFAQRRAAEGRPVDMPFVSHDAWKRIFECAKLGARKGKGRQRPSKTFLKKLEEKLVGDFMRARKRELVDEGMKATGNNSAEDQACEEAAAFALVHFGREDLDNEKIRNLRPDPMFDSRD